VFVLFLGNTVKWYGSLQYLWLERFHAHLETQRLQHGDDETGQEYHNEQVSRSMPSYPEPDDDSRHQESRLGDHRLGTNIGGPMASSMV
jgi:hypothetical protein